jgi:uncharacterized protein
MIKANRIDKTLVLAPCFVFAAIATVVGVAYAGPNDNFFRAVGVDDLSGVSKSIAEGLDPNTANDDGEPAILVAVKGKADRVLKALLANPKTDINATGPFKETALMLMVTRGDKELVGQLLAKGATVNKDGWTALHYAASGGDLQIVKMLLDKGAAIDSLSPNKTTPLMMAARARQTLVVKQLLGFGANPTLSNEAGLSAADYLDRSQESALARDLRSQAEAFKAKPSAPK